MIYLQHPEDLADGDLIMAWADIDDELITEKDKPFTLDRFPLDVFNHYAKSIYVELKKRGFIKTPYPFSKSYNYPKVPVRLNPAFKVLM